MAIEYRKQRDYPFRFGEELTWQLGVARALTWSRRLRSALVIAAPQLTRYVELEARDAEGRVAAAADAVVRLLGVIAFYEVPARLEVEGQALHEALAARRELDGIALVEITGILALRRGRRVFEQHCLHREPLKVERLGA